MKSIHHYLSVNPYSRPGTALGDVRLIVIHYVANPNTSAKANRNYFENLKWQARRSYVAQIPRDENLPASHVSEEDVKETSRIDDVDMIPSSLMFQKQAPRYASSHDIIDLNGDLYHCIPYNEVAYHTGSSLPYTKGSQQVYTPMVWEKLSGTYHVKPNPNMHSIGVECTHIDQKGQMSDATYHRLVDWCAHMLSRYNLPLDALCLHRDVVGWKKCHRFFVDSPMEWRVFCEKVQRKMFA